MSDISSAGSNGKTCRQDVLRGGDVPVVPGAAGRAVPCPGAEGQLREQVPARGAGLAARVEPVGHDQAPPGPGCLVLKLAAELTPAAVGYCLGEGPVADHVRHGQVLDHEHVVVADQPGGSAVQEGRPGTRGPCGCARATFGPGLARPEPLAQAPTGRRVPAWHRPVSRRPSPARARLSSCPRCSRRPLSISRLTRSRYWMRPRPRSRRGLAGTGDWGVKPKDGSVAPRRIPEIDRPPRA